MSWLGFALMTVVSWGLYGAFLARGAKGFEDDRMKAFLFVGVAYFLVAIIGPLIVIALRGERLDLFTKTQGVKWSLIAGIVGALGALTVLFALNKNPIHGPAGASQVMSVVFAGAPIVAAIYGLLNRKDGLSGLDWRFVLGLVLAASGGALVTLFKPS
jgi:uncharacterized membrane protein YeaQ/YmgE (transglycosylase-associated protein family)